MIRLLRSPRLAHDSRGTAIIEFALALPVLLMFIWGIAQMGFLYRANAGMQHALGEAARHATLYVAANNGAPTDAAIRAQVDAKKFGLEVGTLSTLEIDRSQIAADGYMTLSLTYSRPMDFLLFDGPTVTLTRSKRVFVAA